MLGVTSVQSCLRPVNVHLEIFLTIQKLFLSYFMKNKCRFHSTRTHVPQPEGEHFLNCTKWLFDKITEGK